MNVNLKIATTLLTSRIRQLMVAILSVTFGISMYVAMNGFMAGVNEEQTEIAFTTLAHIKIYNDLPTEVTPILPPPEDQEAVLVVNNARNIQYTEGIRNADAIMEAIRAVPEVRAITAQLNQNVFIRNGVSKANATLSGIETESENQLFQTADYLTEGDFFELDRRSNAIILGTGLALRVGVGRGDHVTVTTSDGVDKTFKVVGLFETGAAGTDRAKALVSMQSARQLFSANKSYATEVLVNIQDYNRATTVAEKLEAYTDYRVEAWQEGNAQLDSSNVLRDIIAIAVSLTILIVAGFGIYNIMNMTVNEKMKEIAILNAMGFRSGDVIEIFLAQSIFIGWLGGLTGLLLGNGLIRILDNIPFEVGSLTTLPVSHRLKDYVLALAFGLLITFLAGYLPARKASKIDPVAILRG